MNIKIKYFLVIGLVILSIAVYGYFKSVPGVNNGEIGAQIEVTPQDFNFGEIQYGDIVNHNFIIKNLGQEVLEIKRLSTSCGCTTAKAAKTEINPGEEVALLVTYDSGAMSGSHARGLQERIIYIKSSDAINPQVEVTIHADVK